MMNKIIRDGQVAILYSPGFGAGWYSWHHNKELLFHPDIVALVEQGKRDAITDELIVKLLGCDEDDVPYIGGADQLSVYWLKEGTPFRDDWVVA